MALSRAAYSIKGVLEGVFMQDFRLASALTLSVAERSDISTTAF